MAISVSTFSTFAVVAIWSLLMRNYLITKPIQKFMFEYHGWISFVYSPYEVENEDEKLEEVVDYARNLMSQSFNERHIYELKVINAKYMASFAGFTNHRSSDVEAVIEFFEEIGKKAPGSYGLLYIWDDENPEFDDEFQVGRLVRGKFKFVKDHYLSPRIPVLEDPYTG